MRRAIASLAAALSLSSCGENAAAPAAQAAPPAVPGAWIVDKSASKIEFSGTQTGVAFAGRFQAFDATIVFDPDDLAAATIDTGSAKTGDRQRDAALPGAEWFSSKAFPQARFRSEAVTAAADGYEARGKLTIRETERDLALPFTLKIEGGRAIADAAVTLDRSDFGVGQGEEFLTDKWVGYEVKVTIHIEAVR